MLSIGYDRNIGYDQFFGYYSRNIWFVIPLDPCSQASFRFVITLAQQSTAV